MRSMTTTLLLLILAGCSSAPTERKVSSSGAALEDSFSCRTPGIMDSGYTVSISPGDGNTLHGTIATVSAWGTDKPLYDGPFTVEVLKNAAGKSTIATSAGAHANSGKSCVAQLRGEPKGAKSANVQDPSIFTEGDGRNSSMTLHDGGKTHELSCKFPKPLIESLQKCQAQLKQEGGATIQ